MLGLSLIAAIIFTMRYAAKVKSGKYAKDDRTKPTVATTLDMSNVPKFTGTRKAIMAIFGLTFVIMILSLIPWEDFGVKVFREFHTWLANLPVFGAVMGVSHNVALGNWYFSEISVLFLASAILVGFIYRKEFKKQDVALVDTFIKGIGDLLPVALIIAVATGVSVVMNNGAIQDTVIHWGEDLLKSASGSVIGILAFIFYLPMSVLISSSSGLAAATMPILAPIADLVGAGKDMIVAGYSTAVGLVNLVRAGARAAHEPVSGPAPRQARITAARLSAAPAGSGRIAAKIAVYKLDSQRIALPRALYLGMYELVKAGAVDNSAKNIHKGKSCQKKRASLRYKCDRDRKSVV